MERLTQQEEEVMIYFWKMGPSFIREIVNEMPEPKPPYTSVASVVRNLEKKKFLSPFKLGNSIQYHRTGWTVPAFRTQRCRTVGDFIRWI